MLITEMSQGFVRTFEVRLIPLTNSDSCNYGTKDDDDDAYGEQVD
jgi:hypothetical protein